MPTGTLEGEGKALWEEVYEKAKKGSCKGDEECAARTAWSAVKGAGWSKDSEGKWHKKTVLSQFSLAITRASYDKAKHRMNWRAVASDVDTDAFNDNMTSSLFDDFVTRINSGELPPEKFISDFWRGGTPYMSLSHYPDLNGKAVPGRVEKVYVDGNRLKAVGFFDDTPLGRACFKSVCDDLYGETPNPEGPIRISIAFLDYSHKHKSNGYVYDRETADEPFCIECIREMMEQSKDGLEFRKGHLIHLALTRVPANERTMIEPMEVDKMAISTKKEDALSIIGDDEEARKVLEEVVEEASLVGRSELVIKSETEEEPELVEEAKKYKKEEMMDKDEKEEMHDEEDDEEEKKKEKSVVNDLAPVLDAIAELKSLFSVEKSVPVEAQTHPLDELFTNLKSAYDGVVTASKTPEEALRDIQEPFNAFGNGLAQNIRSAIHVPAPDVNQTVLTQMESMNQKIAELSAMIQQQQRSVSPERPQVVRRSMTPPAPPKMQAPLQSRPGGVKSIDEIVAGTT